MRISHGAKEMNVGVAVPANAPIAVKDIWTTIDGRWEVSSNPYSVPQWAIDEYAIPSELGGSQHIYVGILDKDVNWLKNQRVFYINGNLNEMRETEQKTGYANLPVFNPFYPDQGANGGWRHGPLGIADPFPYVEGGGLPYGLHVSLFVVWQMQDAQNGNGNGDEPMEIEIFRDDTEIVIYPHGHSYTIQVSKF